MRASFPALLLLRQLLFCLLVYLVEGPGFPQVSRTLPAAWILLVSHSATAALHKGVPDLTAADSRTPAGQCCCIGGL